MAVQNKDLPRFSIVSQSPRFKGLAVLLGGLWLLLALAWVWLTPDQSGWHFWWVAQAMPVAYVLLLWWVHGIRSDEPGQR